MEEVAPWTPGYRFGVFQKAKTTSRPQRTQRTYVVGFIVDPGGTIGDLRHISGPKPTAATWAAVSQMYVNGRPQ